MQNSISGVAFDLAMDTSCNSLFFLYSPEEEFCVEIWLFVLIMSAPAVALCPQAIRPKSAISTQNSSPANNRGLQAGCRKEQLKIAELKVAFEGERAKEMRIEGIRLAFFSLEGLHFSENIEARMNSLVRFVH